jgi:hypothetical protein
MAPQEGGEPFSSPAVSNGWSANRLGPKRYGERGPDVTPAIVTLLLLFLQALASIHQAAPLV